MHSRKCGEGPHDLQLDNNISKEFDAFAKSSAVIAVLWRRAAFYKFDIVDCPSERLAAIHATISSGCEILVVSA